MGLVPGTMVNYQPLVEAVLAKARLLYLVKLTGKTLGIAGLILTLLF